MEGRTRSFAELQEAIEEAQRKGESTVPFVYNPGPGEGVFA